MVVLVELWVQRAHAPVNVLGFSGLEVRLALMPWVRPRILATSLLIFTILLGGSMSAMGLFTVGAEVVGGGGRMEMSRGWSLRRE